MLFRFHPFQDCVPLDNGWKPVRDLLPNIGRAAVVSLFRPLCVYQLSQENLGVIVCYLLAVVDNEYSIGQPLSQTHNVCCQNNGLSTLYESDNGFL